MAMVMNEIDKSIRLDDAGRDRVLVVEDELSVRMMTIRTLRWAGYDCMGATSAGEARDLLRSEAFGLVVTDRRMWGEDGLELVRHIADGYPDTFSIVVTGLDDDNLEERSSRAGAFACLRKPADPENIIELAAEAFDRREDSVALRRHLTW